MDGAELGGWRERASGSDQLLAGRRAAHAGHGHAVLHDHGERGREQSHARAGHERRDDDPGDALGKCHHEQEQPENVHDDPDHARKPFSDPMHQSAGAESERAPADRESTHHQADDRAVLMKSGVRRERQIRAQAEAAEEGEERRRGRRCVARMMKEAQRQNGVRRSSLVPHENREQDDPRGNERRLDQPDFSFSEIYKRPHQKAPATAGEEGAGNANSRDC